MKIDTTAVRVEMARRNWNMKDLAKYSDLAYSTVTSILSGTRNGSVKTLGKIANGLNVDVTKILTDEKQDLLYDLMLEQKEGM